MNETSVPAFCTHGEKAQKTVMLTKVPVFATCVLSRAIKVIYHNLASLSLMAGRGRRGGKWGKRARSGSLTGVEAVAAKRLRSPLFPTLEQKLLSKPPDLMPRGRDKDLMNRYRKYREEMQMSPFYMSTEEQVNVRYSDQKRQVPTDRPLPTWLPQYQPERYLPQRLCRWLNVSVCKLPSTSA